MIEMGFCIDLIISNSCFHFVMVTYKNTQPKTLFTLRVVNVVWNIFTSISGLHSHCQTIFDVSGRLIQEHRPAARGRINGLSGVELAGGETESALRICHDAPSSKGNVQETFGPASTDTVQ